MNKHLVATTPDGVAVYINLVASTAGKQVSIQPHLLNLAQEIITQRSLEGAILTIETHMGRLVGTNAVVKTTAADTVFYAKPIGSDEFRRFVKNHSYTPSSYLTLSLSYDSANASYELTDIVIGRRRPALPSITDSPRQQRTARSYWDTHAYIWESKACQSQSITKICPWAVTGSEQPQAV